MQGRGKAKGKGKAKLRAPVEKQAPPPASEKPDWAPPPCPGWERALQTVEDLPQHQQHHGGRAFLYAVPPLHAFYGLAESRTPLMHNWTRIRPWCITQALEPPQNARVLMTASQWHLALQGLYYWVPPELLTVHPKSTDAEIARLPLEPAPAKRARTENKPPSHRNSKRLADRVDIAVRMVLYAHIPPYDPDVDVGHFGKLRVSRAVAATDCDLWSEVVWELSLLNFRLELLELDRTVLEARYGGPGDDRDCAGDRQRAICAIWSDMQAVRPSLLHEIKRDLLSLPDWRERRPAFERWADVMREWPGGSAVGHASRDRDSEAACGEFEVGVIGFYCRAFHGAFARLPTVPLCGPKSLLRHL